MGLEQLLPAIAGMTWQHLVMIAIDKITCLKNSLLLFKAKNIDKYSK